MRDKTLVLVHAHPDDECVLTGATMAKAAALGMRTVVVYGTRGDAGETGTDLGGESLGDRRMREAEAACADLGVARVEWLRYADSGMAGSETTANPDAFSNADPARVALQIAELVADEDVVAMVGYDANGTYGHPDHAQVHHVAHAFAPLRVEAWVLEATYSREYLASLPDADGTLDLSFASAEADLTHYVQGAEWLDAKIRAIGHHRSQVPDDWDTEKPDYSGFSARFGTEWFIAHQPRARVGVDLGPLLDPKPSWPGPLPI